MPAYWLFYFSVDDVDAAARQAVELGGQQLMPPQDYPGGRFAVLSDPQGGRGVRSVQAFRGRAG